MNHTNITLRLPRDMWWLLLWYMMIYIYDVDNRDDEQYVSLVNNGRVKQNKPMPMLQRLSINSCSYTKTNSHCTDKKARTVQYSTWCYLLLDKLDKGITICCLIYFPLYRSQSMLLIWCRCFCTGSFTCVIPNCPSQANETFWMTSMELEDLGVFLGDI